MCSYCNIQTINLLIYRWRWRVACIVWRCLFWGLVFLRLDRLSGAHLAGQDNTKHQCLSQCESCSCSFKASQDAVPKSEWAARHFFSFWKICLELPTWSVYSNNLCQSRSLGMLIKCFQWWQRHCGSIRFSSHNSPCWWLHCQASQDHSESPEEACQD